MSLLATFSEAKSIFMSDTHNLTSAVNAEDHCLDPVVRPSFLKLATQHLTRTVLFAVPCNLTYKNKKPCHKTEYIWTYAM